MRIADDDMVTMSKPPTRAGLVVFTPLPPLPNGIADYSYELLGGLAAHFDCTVVVEDGSIGTLAPAGVTVITETEYRLRAASLASLLHLYQLGNNRDHIYILPYLQSCPGLVVLHDLTLHYLLDQAAMGVDDVARYIDALEAEHGAAGLVLGEQFRRFGLRENNLFFDMPMTGGVIRSSRGIIVHSKYGAVKVRARCPSAPVTVVPHQYSPPPPDEIQDAANVRRELGVADSDLLFMSLGFASRAKRIDSAMRALAAIRDRLPPFKYVIAGEQRPHEVDIPGLTASLGLRDQVIVTGYVAERRFFSLLQAADVVINLRYPIGGETSGTMIRALGAGACVVVVDRGPFAEIAPGAAMPLRWGPGFDERLAEALLRLAQDPALRRRIGDTARAVTTTANSLDMTVAGYRSAIAKAQAAKAPTCNTSRTWAFPPPSRVNRLAVGARRDLAGEALPVWFSGAMVPVSGQPATRMVTIGAGKNENSLLQHLGYGSGTGRNLSLAEAGEVPEHERCSADLIICFSEADAAGAEERQMLRALNQRLAFGGMLVWCVARGSEHGARSPLEQRQSGHQLLQSCGFRVDRSITGNEPLINDPSAPPADAVVTEERCWRAYKTSESFVNPDASADLLRGLSQSVPA
jgi:glycosyltransferase involved in cell wall biosynthesis